MHLPGVTGPVDFHPEGNSLLKNCMDGLPCWYNRYEIRQWVRAIAAAVDAWKAAGDWVSIGDTSEMTVSGLGAVPGNAWLKECKYLTKPMYYLRVEETVSRTGD